MTTLSRREILAALASIAAVAAVPGFAQSPGSVDLSAGRAIGQAWLAAHPGTNLDRLRARHLPAGLDSKSLSQLRARAASDFRHGRTFVHEGWVMSETEAQLFALLTA